MQILILSYIILIKIEGTYATTGADNVAYINVFWLC